MLSYLRTHLFTKKRIKKNYIHLNVFGIPLIMVSRFVFIFNFFFLSNIFGSAHYGTGSGPILYQVNCNGYETDIAECGLSDWGTTGCGHHEDVGVDCGDGT